MTIKPSTKREIQEFCLNPQLLNYCAMICRPGLYAWMVELEYTRFKPDTDANDRFHLLFSQWPEPDPIPNITMAIVSFDKSEQAFADSILWKHGLRKTGSDYVPTIIDEKGMHEFFLQGRNIIFLENHSKGAPNVIYSNDPLKIQRAWEHEKSQVQHFFDDHAQWIKTPEGKAIADAYWAKHPEGHCL